MKKYAKPTPFLVVFLIVVLASFGNTSNVWAHLEGTPFYNGGGGKAGPYWVSTAVEPYFASPNEEVELVFSVQKEFGDHVYNIYTMIEIYDAATHERVFLSPWTYHEIGDFTLEYKFEKAGGYQVVLSISESGNHDDSIPQRNILFDNSDCNCYRTISNIVISENNGTVWNFIMGIVVLLPMSVLGYALYLNYKRSSRHWKNALIGKLESVRYLVTLTAIASGIVHFLVYAQHASMRWEWSLFLLMAASLQVIYGVYYLSMTMRMSFKLKDETKGFTDMASPRAMAYLHTPLKIQLLGLIGSLSLIGLYIYVMIFPAPLSPSNLPEDFSIIGVVSKTTEVLVVFAIFWLIRLEHKVVKSLIKVK